MPGISDLLVSDMEDSHHIIDENSLLSSEPESAESKNLVPAKKTRKRKCVTMPKPKTRIAKSSPVSKVKKATKKVASAIQKAIEDQIEDEVPARGQAGHALGDDETEEEVVKKPRGKTAHKQKLARDAAPGLVADEEGMEVDQTPLIVRSSHAASKPKNSAPKPVRAAKAPAKKKDVPDTIEETQVETMAIEIEADELETITHQQAKPVRARPESRIRQESTFRRRAGSASDTERGDPNLRRKLGDITRKFENVDTKFRHLKEVGITEANNNVEKLRKQCEATTEASENLIASLRRELNISAPLAQDARRLRSELDAQTSEIALLRETNKELTTSLTSAQNEIKALQAKLAAARKASAEPVATTNNKTPKGSVQSRPTMMNGNTNESAQLAQMKLDLYSDLTGLIVRSVKHSEDGDTYDCIQTGRNGTLHFKLFIDAEDAKSASFEETEFLYTPLLDTNRDKEMIELMPPYLTEDITFARQNAAKFYQRVVDTLTRRIESNEE